jgi:formamidopyrimidine-DNA glycosylase
MPELPDVEGFRRYFARYATGRRIRSVRVHDAALARNATAQLLGRALTGRRFGKPSRTGKWLMAPAEGPCLVMHFGMTGLLKWTSDGRDHRHDRLVFQLENGRLRYRNMRRFGGVWLASSAADVERITGPLGPDAMRLERGRLRDLLSERRGGIKAALMDQRVVAGIGNLLSDEVLWRARIHPRESAHDLSPRRLDALDRELREVITASNRHGRIPPIEGWLTGARNSRDARCPRCNARLRRGAVAGRTAYWCPRCQRER